MFGRSSNPEEQLREPRRRSAGGVDNHQAVGNGLPGFLKRPSSHRGQQNGSEVLHGMDSRPSALRMALQAGGDRARWSTDIGIGTNDAQQHQHQVQQAQQQRRRGGSGEESRRRESTTTSAAASWELHEPAQPRGSSPVFRPPSVRQRQGGLNVSQSQGGGGGGGGGVSYEGQLFDSRESAGGRASASSRAPGPGYRDSVADSGVPSFGTGGGGSGRGRGVAPGRSSMRAGGGIVRSQNFTGIGNRTTPAESSGSCRRGSAGNVAGHGRSSTNNQAEDAVSSGTTPRKRASSSGRAASCSSGSPYLELGFQRSGIESGGHNSSSRGGRIRRRGDHDDGDGDGDEDDGNLYGRRSTGDTAVGNARHRDNHPHGRGGGRGGAHARASPSTAPAASAGPADLDRLPSIDGLEINNPSDNYPGGGGGGLRGDAEIVVASSSASASMGQRRDRDNAGTGGGRSNSLAAAERRLPGKGIGSETSGQRGSGNSRNSDSGHGNGSNGNGSNNDDDDDRGEGSGRDVALSSRRIGSGGTGGSNSNGGGSSTKYNARGSSSSSSNNNNKSSRECLVGLQNLGNTCFMNACLQCLLHTDSLVDLFRGRRLQQEQRLSSHNNNSPTNGALAEAFAELVALVEASPAHSNVSPAQVKRLIGKYAPHLAGYGQQDCQEFLRFFLDGLSEDLNRRGGGGGGNNNHHHQHHHHHHHRGAQRASQQQHRDGPGMGRGGGSAPVVPDVSDEEISRMPMEQQADRAWAMHLARNDSEITGMFCGQLQSRISCLSCGNVSFCFDPFFDLSVPLSTGAGGGRGGGGAGDGGGGGYGGRRGSGSSSSSSVASSSATTTLEDCLRAFSAEETLDGDNRPVCARCRRRRKSSKSLAIHRFPPILVIHLKRFQYNSTSRTKLSTAVDFPIGSGLDLVPYSTAAARPSSSGNSAAGDADDDRRRRDSSNSGGGYGHSQGGFRAAAGGGNTGSRSPPPLYELYAVCNHMGGLQGGHYTAHCRSGSSGGRVPGVEWHTFDDTRVVGPINTSRVGGASAYVLFYRLHS